MHDSVQLAGFKSHQSPFHPLSAKLLYFASFGIKQSLVEQNASLKRQPRAQLSRHGTMDSGSASKQTITLKGSTDTVTEFFSYALSSILFQRGVYPSESFEGQKKFGLTVMAVKDPKLAEYLATVLKQFTGTPPWNTHHPLKIYSALSNVPMSLPLHFILLSSHRLILAHSTTNQPPCPLNPSFHIYTHSCRLAGQWNIAKGGACHLQYGFQRGCGAVGV